MAEGWLRSFGGDVAVYSAGTEPAASVNPRAIAVMKERGIDIGAQTPKSTDLFLAQTFDYVITVCDEARETCPAFSGNVGRRLHMGFEDPTHAVGNETEIMDAFRSARDLIAEEFRKFHEKELRPA